MARPRVVIADDSEAIRYLIRTIAERDCDIVGEAEDGAEAIALAETLQPDVLIPDISMPLLSGIEVLRTLKARRPELRVIIASQHADRTFIEEAARIGASGYVVKQSAVTEVPLAIQEVMAGRFFSSPRAA